MINVNIGNFFSRCPYESLEDRDSHAYNCSNEYIPTLVEIVEEDTSQEEGTLNLEIGNRSYECSHVKGNKSIHGIDEDGMLLGPVDFSMDIERN